MPRSRFEQLIDAGLASANPPAPASRAYRALSETTPGLDRIVFGVKAKDSHRRPQPATPDPSQAYCDWLLPSSDDKIEQPPSEQASESEIASLLEQLANHKRMTRAQLQALRRQLARRLHPDLAPSADRVAATAEMAKLNAIIDAALLAHPR